MKRYLGWLLVLTCGGLCQLPATAQTPADPVQRALEEEAKRAMTVLTQKGNPKPYFLSYQVNESKTSEILADEYLRIKVSAEFVKSTCCQLGREIEFR